MKQYLLTVCYPRDGTQPSPEALERITQDVNAVNREMLAAGAWIFAGGLHPASTATTVQFLNHELLVTDGPFAEGKEHIGGLSILRAPDLDAALGWARKLATAIPGVAIEVRPFQDQSSP
ncbi:MAG: YciI family protein [Steroidobacteraceae bacterium]